MTCQRMTTPNRFTIPDIDGDLLGRGGMGDVHRVRDNPIHPRTAKEGAYENIKLHRCKGATPGKGL